ncbi:MAG TPA: glycosyltransferase, partial [Acidimicrobiales bacterium]|nr:glycosyltransferase [Acidimicrobiales bacterium]
CSFPNLQHHRIVTQLLRGDFHYAAPGPLDPSFVHLFTATGAVQLLLDAGFVPDVTDRVEGPPGTDPAAALSAEATVAAGAPLLERLGVGAKDAERDLATRWLVVRGTAQEPVDPAEEIPVTVVACVNDEAQLEANLLRSPCLAPGTPHEVLLFRDRTSAAEGLNAGIEQARNELVVLVHQDVYLPAGWPARLARQWRLASARGATVGIAGVFGVESRRIAFDATGHVVHRDRRLHHKVLPCDVDGLDELLMVVPRDTPLRADPELGWHLYGTDLALQAQARRLRAVVLDAPCHHNSLTGRVPWQYRQSERVLARKWRSMLPIHTNLSSIDTWLLDAPPGDDHAGEHGAPGAAGEAEAVAALVASLRREQAALHRELEQARLQVASMQASPFWRARQLYAGVRERLVRRR